MISIKIKKSSISNLINNTPILFLILYSIILLFGFNPDLMENSSIYKNIVLPYVELNITVALSLISIVCIFLLFMKRKIRTDNISLLLAIRILLYFIPYFYITGEFRIGVAYAVFQCLFSYFIGYQFHDDYEKVVRVLFVLSVAIGIEVFIVLLVNHITIFSSNLKWYMVLPMGKSNYISCYLLPIFVMVDNYLEKSTNILIRCSYMVFILLAILGTGSKLALLLFLVFIIVKLFINLFKKRKTTTNKVLRVLIISIVIIAGIFTILCVFQSGLLFIAQKFNYNIFENRILVYNATFLQLFDHFLLGRSAFKFYVFDATKTHNFILESLMQTGIVGTILFTTILILVFNKIKKISEKNTRDSLILFFFMFLVQGLVEPNMFGATSDAFFWLIIGIGCAISADNKKGVIY